MFFMFDERLDSQWDNVKQICSSILVDVLLLCHFYGSYHEVSKAKNYCEQKIILIVDSENGYVVIVGDEKALADRVMYLAMHEEIRKDLL